MTWNCFLPVRDLYGVFGLPYRLDRVVWKKQAKDTAVDQTFSLFCVSEYFVLLMESRDSGLYGGFMSSIFLTS